MYLRKVKSAPCQPVSLEEARRNLAIDASTVSEDDLINLLIESATADAEMKTGRVFVESEWEWKPDECEKGVDIEFPTCPVTKVQVFKEDDPLTDISGDLFDIIYPSPEPQGTPLLGWLRPKAAFPENAKIVLTVGYPYSTEEKPQEQKEPPVLDIEKTKYTLHKIHLVFNRSVEVFAKPDDFDIVVDDVPVTVDKVVADKGGVTLTLIEELTEASTVQMNFIEGMIVDQFNNYVQPIFNQQLPVVSIGTEQDFIEPNPVPMEEHYTSLCPAPVKQWILVRTGTLYSQRTEIALRAGKSNDALYPDGFINNLLNPYRVRFA